MANGIKLVRVACSLSLLAAGLATATQAAVVISSASTQGMNCSGGVCAPTNSDAVLNVSDLQNLLAAGNVEVTTTGSGVQATDILVSAAMSWSNMSTLSLNAYQSITINKAVSIKGVGGLSLTTNDGGSGGQLSFGRKGRAAFQNLSSQLTINGATYTLVNSVKSLASAIAANPSGDYALADNYDASVDGVYKASPIQTTFTGALEGLGNRMSYLTIEYKRNTPTFIGFFAINSGLITSLRLSQEKVIVSKLNPPDGGIVGGIAGINYGSIFDTSVTGTFSGQAACVGGLVGTNGHVISGSYAEVEIIDALSNSVIGGLVGLTSGTLNTVGVNNSFATGSVLANGQENIVGGIVGINVEDEVQNSYANGAVTAGAHALVGGFAGENGEGRSTPGAIEDSYSTGTVSGGRSSKVGGFAGRAYRIGTVGFIAHSYWDTTTSGTDIGVGKGNRRGVSGMTTQQLQSGLPSRPRQSI